MAFHWGQKRHESCTTFSNIKTHVEEIREGGGGDKTSASVLNASVRSHTDTKSNGKSLQLRTHLHSRSSAPPTHRAKYDAKQKTKEIERYYHDYILPPKSRFCTLMAISAGDFENLSHFNTLRVVFILSYKSITLIALVD